MAVKKNHASVTHLTLFSFPLRSFVLHCVTFKLNGRSVQWLSAWSFALRSISVSNIVHDRNGGPANVWPRKKLKRDVTESSASTATRTLPSSCNYLIEVSRLNSSRNVKRIFRLRCITRVTYITTLEIQWNLYLLADLPDDHVLLLIQALYVRVQSCLHDIFLASTRINVTFTLASLLFRLELCWQTSDLLFASNIICSTRWSRTASRCSPVKRISGANERAI